MDVTKRVEYQEQLDNLGATRNRLGAIRDKERREGLSSEERAEATRCHEKISGLTRYLESEGVFDDWHFLTPAALELELRKTG